MLVASSSLYPVWLKAAVHVMTLILLVALFRYGQRIGRVVATFFGVLFLIPSQHIAMTPTYGLVVVTGNLVLVSIVGLSWLWEAYRPKNDYTFQHLPVWRYWVVPFAILAFWFPLGLDLMPNFDPLLLLTSDFGLYFCPTAPVAIALLTLIHPQVNKRLLAVTSLVGLLIGFFNAMSLFTLPGYTPWMLFLHTPLILISLYGLLLPWLVRSPSSTGR